MLCWPVNGLPELFGTNIIIADFVGFLAGDIRRLNNPEFHGFHGLILPHFCYSSSKIAIIPTNFMENSLKLAWKQWYEGINALIKLIVALLCKS